MLYGLVVKNAGPYFDAFCIYTYTGPYTYTYADTDTYKHADTHTRAHTHIYRCVTDGAHNLDHDDCYVQTLSTPKSKKAKPRTASRRPGLTEHVGLGLSEFRRGLFLCGPSVLDP